MHFHLRHLHLRKRKHPSTEGDPYPHTSPGVRFLDKLLVFVAVVGPLANISQIIKIYGEMDAEGVSLTSWSMYIVFNIIWIIYGIVHKERVILLAHILWFITQTIVVVGIILYG